MNSSLLYLRLFIMVAIPYAIVDYYSITFYHLSLWSVIEWWATHLGDIKDVWAYFLGLFFVLLVYFLSVSGLFNLILLSLIGEKQELVYLGNKGENKAVYYKRDDMQRQAFNAYEIDNRYNYSFGGLYRSQTFIKDPGEIRKGTLSAAGTKNNRFHPYSWIAQIIGFIAFSMITIITLNAFIHKTYVANLSPPDEMTVFEKEIDLPREDPLLAFDAITARLSLTRGYYFSLMIALVFIWLGFNIATPANKLSEPLYNLPSYIVPGESISGIPVEIAIRYTKVKTSSNPDRYDTVDSGQRYITFTFSRGFDHDVYVTTLISINSHSKQIDEIKKAIENRTAMDITVGDDLSISITADEISTAML